MDALPADNDEQGSAVSNHLSRESKIGIITDIGADKATSPLEKRRLGVQAATPIGKENVFATRISGQTGRASLSRRYRRPREVVDRRK